MKQENSVVIKHQCKVPWSQGSSPTKTRSLTHRKMNKMQDSQRLHNLSQDKTITEETTSKQLITVNH